MMFGTAVFLGFILPFVCHGCELLPKWPEHAASLDDINIPDMFSIALFKDGVYSTTLEHFEGHWLLEKNLSDTGDSVLKLMGISNAKRRAVRKHRTELTFKILSEDKI
eukprot:Trichotokara_eunicae@DN2733_c0_g1_i5.p1